MKNFKNIPRVILASIFGTVLLFSQTGYTNDSHKPFAKTLAILKRCAGLITGTSLPSSLAAKETINSQQQPAAPIGKISDLTWKLAEKINPVTDYRYFLQESFVIKPVTLDSESFGIQIFNSKYSGSGIRMVYMQLLKETALGTASNPRQLLEGYIVNAHFFDSRLEDDLNPLAYLIAAQIAYKFDGLKIHSTHIEGAKPNTVWTQLAELGLAHQVDAIYSYPTVQPVKVYEIDIGKFSAEDKEKLSLFVHNHAWKPLLYGTRDDIYD